jgi:hypothetical protein
MKRLTSASSVCVVAALGFAATASATPAPDPAKDCKKGYVLVATGADPSSYASSFDADGNGFVCYDPTTDSFRDDKGQFSPDGTGGVAVDENGDGFVCYDAGRGAVIDDTLDPTSPTGFTCPAGFEPVPATLV